MSVRSALSASLSPREKGRGEGPARPRIDLATGSHARVGMRPDALRGSSAPRPSARGAWRRHSHAERGNERHRMPRATPSPRPSPAMGGRETRTDGTPDSRLTDRRAGGCPMSFLTPLYILGALAIAAPIVLHLIRRTPKGEVPFSSLMFLAPTPPRLTRRSRLDNILLLLAPGRRPWPCWPWRSPGRSSARPASLNFGDVERRRDRRPGRHQRQPPPRRPLAQGQGPRRGRDRRRPAGRPARRLRLRLDHPAAPDLRRVGHARPRQAAGDRQGPARRPGADLGLDRPRPGAGRRRRRDRGRRRRLREGRPDAPADRPGQRPPARQPARRPGRLRVALRRRTRPQDRDRPRPQRRPPAGQRVDRGRPPPRSPRSCGSGSPTTRARAARRSSSPGSTPRGPRSARRSTPTSRPARAGSSRSPECPASRPSASRGTPHGFDNTLYLAAEAKGEATVLYVGNDAPDDAEGLLYYLGRVFEDTPRRTVKVVAKKPTEPD